MTLSSEPVDLAAAAPPAWVPGPDVTDLVGEPLPPTALFDVAPPDDIGEVIAAWTPARIEKAERPVWMRWLTLIAVPAVFFFVGGPLLDSMFTTGRDRADAETWHLIATLLVLGVTAFFVFRRPNKYLFYVGKEGVARLLVGRPDKPGVVLRFAHAAGLRAGQTRQYYNGVYTGTSYTYTWFGPDAKTLLKLGGSFRNDKKARGTNNPYRFLLDAETMWNNHYLDRAQAEFEKTGAVVFHVNAKDSLRVSPARMEFSMKGEQVAIEKDDIAAINLGGGVFTVRHKDAKWYKRGGKYSFNYANMSNAQVFLIVLEKLLGYRFD